MVTDGNIIKEARFFVKAYSKEFCQTYSDLCGSPFAECIKSIDVNRFLYKNREDMR